MRKTNSHQRVDPDRDTMRKEYDFSGAARCVTATRYGQGANVVVIDPEVLDVFPDALAVNEALCALAPVLRRQRDSRAQRKTRLATSSKGRR
jgi:hypothetical protein